MEYARKPYDILGAEGVHGVSGRHQLTAWIVILSASTFFFYQFIQLTMFNSLSQILLVDFHLQPVEVSYLSTAYFVTSLLSLIPAGIVLDYFSTKRVIISAISVSMIALIMFALSQSLVLAIAARFLSGFAGAFCFLSAVKLASRWFRQEKLANVVGVIVSIGLLGGIVAQNPIISLIATIGWRHTMMSLVLLGFICIVIVMFMVRDFPLEEVRQSRNIILSEYTQNIWGVLRKLDNWLVGFYISLMNIPIFVFGAMWGDRYLMHVYAVNASKAGLISSMLFVGMIIGSPSVGWLSNRVSSPLRIMSVGAILLTITYLLLFSSVEFSVPTLSCIFLLIGIFSSVQVLGYPIIADINSPTLTATAEGLASTLMISGGLSQTLFALLIQSKIKLPFLVNTTYENFAVALLIMPICSLVAYVISFYLHYLEGRS